MLKFAKAGVLNVGYIEAGPEGGTPVILLHGFPYDVHAYDEVTPLLVSQGCRIITPYLRGYGPTRFLSANTPRSGQQAMLALDLLALMDALSIPNGVLAGYDWGGRAACIVAALWPERACGLVTGGVAYNIQDIARAGKPLAPEDEHRLWYQYYFHSERGRAGLSQNRHALCKFLWRLWSPTWNFDDATYDQTAASFDNPDFVNVVIHSYRHRFGLVPGDPAAEATERRLSEQPNISVPTVVLNGEADEVTPPDGSERHQRFFTGSYERRIVAGVGHDLPQEAPREFAAAVLSLAKQE
jgi:pimeloyl-ACP methyl ester carboxylesterase